MKATLLMRFDQVLNNLASKVVLIAKRYEHTLGEIEEKTVQLKAKVKSALERMGIHTNHSKDTIEYNEIKKIYKRVRGTPITAERMSKIKSATGAIRVFAGGATEIRANVSDLPNANIISDPVVIVQSRGVIDFIYCNVPCTFKNEMWGYTSSDIYAVKFLFYYLKHNVDYFRNAGDGRSSFSQISLPVTRRV